MRQNTENIIKPRESVIALLIIGLALIYIPFKIASYGWTPADDATRHSAFATVNKEWSDIVVIKPEYSADHNPGWHSVLRFIHKIGANKTNLLRFSFIGLFLFVNFAGIIVSPKPIAWFASLFLLLITEPGILGRLLLGRPYLFSFAITLLLFKLWSDQKLSIKSQIKLPISVILITLSVWIHGSWYLFLLIPFSFFLAGKNKAALQLFACIIAGTLLGALLSGDFAGFLRFHTFATINIFSEKTFNWLLVTEFRAGNIPIIWLLVAVPIIFYLSNINKLNPRELLSDPVFMMVLLNWMLGIMTIRFWIDWGLPALMYWLSFRISDVLNSSDIFKEPRIKYGLTLFMIVSTVFVATNDGGGRFSKAVFDQPIDFSEERLKGWAPEPGAIIYSNNMGVFYKHFHAYPEMPWKYILGFESALMPDEDRKILRNIGYNFGRTEEFLPWINKMRPGDRMILYGNLKDVPNTEWIQGSRFCWIGRKTASATANITTPPTSDTP